MSTNPVLNIPQVPSGGNNFNPYFNDMAGKVTGTVQAAGGALAFGQGLKDEINRFRDASFVEADTMIGGIPSYTGVSALQGQYSAVRESEAGKGLIGGGAMAGASLGASVGSFFPGLGTAIGAGIGAIAGTITGIFGKKKAKKEKAKAEKRAHEALVESQEDYNVDVGGYFEDITSDRMQAQSERAYQRRLYGTNITDPFASII